MITSRRALLLALTVLALATPAILSAQSVHGTVVSQDEGRVVPGASVVLLRDDGAAMDSVVTTSAGSYTLEAGGPGTFVVYTTVPGFASYTSAPFRLEAGATRELRIELPLISVDAMQLMGSVIDADSTLQQDLPSMCGEELRPWESGIVVGVVRQRGTFDPVPGALVMLVPPPDSAGNDRPPIATISNRKGTYFFCNVPVGEHPLRVRAEHWRAREVKVEVRAGMIGWYDVLLYQDPNWSPGSSASRREARGSFAIAKARRDR